MRVVGLAALLLTCLATSSARAQGDEVVPPPPEHGVRPSAGPPMLRGVPVDLVVAPLLAAAEADLAGGRGPLALARASVVAEVLPDGLPLRVRADGLRLLAAQRAGEGSPAPPPDEVYAPLIAQADLDLRAGQPQLALARLDFVLARLSGAAPLTLRAQQLRQIAASMMGGPPQGPQGPLGSPLAPSIAPSIASSPAGPAPAPRRDDLRGTGEIVELYITAAGLGALTGAYLPFMISDAGASTPTYGLTMLAGAALFAVGVLTLDLTLDLPSGVPPTISASIRFGFAHGMLAFAIDASNRTFLDGDVSFSLVWAGTLAGALTGLAVGFGATPTVEEERLVESAGFWGAGLGTFVALMTQFRDPSTSWGLLLAGLDLGLLTGIVMAASESVPSMGRTLFLDLGFLGGSGVGALVPALYYAYSDERPDTAFFGAAMGIGAVAGWLLTFFLTEGMDASVAPRGAPTVHLGVSPIEGGAVLGMSGAF